MSQYVGKRGKSSRYKGVYHHEKRDVYIVVIWNPDLKRSVHLGVFQNEIHAALAYDEAVTRTYGEGAVTNESLGLFDRESPRNAVEIVGGVARMQLSTGEVLLDAEDYPRVRDHVWRMGGPGGVCTGEPSHPVRMHRLLLGVGDGEVVRHINGDPLDNRRANLKVMSKSAASVPQGHKGGGFKGVYLDKRRGKPYSLIAHLGKRVYLGSYGTEVEAARAYDRKAEELHGDDAVTNESLGLF